MCSNEQESRLAHLTLHVTVALKDDKGVALWFMLLWVGVGLIANDTDLHKHS